MTTRYTVTTAKHGYESSEEFSDIRFAGDLKGPVIRRVVVGFSEYIQSLTVYLLYFGSVILPVAYCQVKVHYVGSNQAAVQHGVKGTNESEVVLERDEWITEIQGTHFPQVISSLKFMSNKRRTWGPFGKVDGTGFVLEPTDQVPPHLKSTMGLLYFQGKCDTGYIRKIQATFTQYSVTVERPGMLKFETQTGAEPTVQSAGILTTFARQLMSPIITLRIGTKKTEFRAPEAILCQLPFFQAALQGRFKEASEKLITMPEDEPETVSALIEFLYTGGYTYAFKPQVSGDIDGASGVPGGDVTQGAFHAAVYALASKYDCQGLAAAAVGNFNYVLKQLDGHDVIELWKAAYVKGLYLSQFETDGDHCTFIAGLGKVVGDSYRTQREEMDNMVSEYPAFATDLLRIITTGDMV